MWVHLATDFNILGELRSIGEFRQLIDFGKSSVSKNVDEMHAGTHQSQYFSGQKIK
jgi:hypothetical protein